MNSSKAVPPPDSTAAHDIDYALAKQTRVGSFQPCRRPTRTLSSLLMTPSYRAIRCFWKYSTTISQNTNEVCTLEMTTDAFFSTAQHEKGWAHPVGSKRLVRRRRRHPWLLHGAVLLAGWCLCGAWVDAYTLRVRVQPGRAQGGVAFLEQPQVEILEGNGGDIDVFFEVGYYVVNVPWWQRSRRCFVVAVGLFLVWWTLVSLVLEHVCYLTY